MSNDFDPFDYENNADIALKKSKKAYSDATDLMAVNARKACIEKLFEALSQFSNYVRYKSKVPEVKVGIQVKACWPRTVRLISNVYLDFASILLRFYYCFGMGCEFHKAEDVEGKIETLLQGLEKINSFLPQDLKNEFLSFKEDFEKAKKSHREYKEIIQANIENGCHDPDSIEILDKSDTYFKYIQGAWKDIAYKGICPLRSADELYASDNSGCVWGCLAVVGLFFLVIAIGSVIAQIAQKPNSQITNKNTSQSSSYSSNTSEQTNPSINQEIYPKASCGDLMPRNSNEFPVDFYPVYVDFGEAELSLIKSRFCGDAYRIIRESTGQAGIQVASFTTRQRAERFRDFLIDSIGNAEVGEPKRFDRPPS